MATILDPSDPALGNSYEDGVERARRVNMKKKKKPGESLGDTPLVSAPGDTAMLQEAGALPKGVAPEQLGQTQLSGGWSGYQDQSAAGSLYYMAPGEIERQRKLRKPPGQSTILGG